MKAIACIFGFVLMAAATGGRCQQAAAPIERPAPARDAQVEAASSLIGRAVFLRCFCAENSLSFDTSGHLAGTPKTTDWTLAAVNVVKVERRGANAIELEGVRVAVRYLPDLHEFQRRPQNDEKVHLQVADGGDAKQFARALEAAFAVGIDLPLQRSMPAYWQHYFDPRLVWQDGLAAEPIYIPGGAGAVLGPANAAMIPPSTGKPPVTVSQPGVTHRANLSYTTPAAKDRVKGTVQLRFVVDAQGLPHRVSIVQPLGYGLDARAVQAVEKYKFAPAEREGKPVASTVLMNQEFTLLEQQVE